MRFIGLVLVCAFACGCGESQNRPLLEAARRNLQINRTQQAIDLLAKDSSAEGHYLKGVALYRLNLRNPAEEEIQAALKLKPKVAKYRGFELLLELANKNRTAIDQLIALYDENRSSGAISLFVTSAFTIKGDAQRSLEAFDASLALASDAPEFMFELLKHAVGTGRTIAATTLIDRLEI